MAVVATDPNMQQDENAQDKAPSGSTQPINVSGTSASGSGGGASSQAPQGGQASATPAGSSSGRFQNIQNYLNANKGYNEGQGLAGQVGQTLTDQESKQEQAIGQESQRVQSQAQTAAQPYSYYANPQQGQADPYLTYSIANATQTANDPNALAAWKNYYSGAYTAPQSFDTSGQLGQNQQNFQQTAGQAGSEQGRMALLQQLYGNPGYSTGQQSLDNLLLQSNPDQLTNLQSTSGQLSQQLGGAYNTGQTNAQNAITQGQQQAALAKAVAAPALGQAETNFETGLNQRTSDINTSNQNSYNKFIQDIGQNYSGALAPQELQSLGLNPSSQLYGLSPDQIAQYINLQSVNKYQVATPDDYAKAQALSTLGGQPINTFLPNSDISQSGTASINPYTVNQVGLQNAINNQKASYNTDYSNISIPDLISQINNGQTQYWTGNAPSVSGIGKNIDPYLDMQQAKQFANYISGVEGQQPDNINNYVNQLQNLINKYNPNKLYGQIS